jgi:hypothetical protein
MAEKPPRISKASRWAGGTVKPWPKNRRAARLIFEPQRDRKAA